MEFPIEKKLVFVVLVSNLKASLDEMFTDLSGLVEYVNKADFSRQPMNDMTAKYIREIYAGEHGQLLRALRTQVHSIYDRLRDCGGNTDTVLDIIDEVAKLMPNVTRLDAQLSEMHDEINNRSKTVIEMN
jgi:UTP:GlnB (protein PII) uridylyltransferase